MESKLVLPGITYEKIKPGQIFTNKHAKKLFVMTAEKIKIENREEIDQLKCIEIEPNGYPIESIHTIKVSATYKDKTRVEYKEKNIFEMFTHTNSLRQI